MNFTYIYTNERYMILTENHLTRYSFEISSTMISANRGLGKKTTTEHTASIMKQPINNYLKSPEELEEEMRKYDGPREYHSQLRQQDGYTNIHTLDEALSRCMEENY